MRNYEKEFAQRVQFIKQVVRESGADGIVYGNSGGKDSALVGILCKAACDNTVGIIMPCATARNFEMDKRDGEEVAKAYGIETRYADLSAVKSAEKAALAGVTELSPAAEANIAPRLRMATLYAVAATENRLVSGTGNRSEGFVGYFTKWGDGACDFNPIADLTVTEIYEFLRYLKAPQCVIEKAPSAGLFDGQTDESEMGFTYKELDTYLDGGKIDDAALERIQRMHARSEHKRREILTF
mgnify:FL=1